MSKIFNKVEIYGSGSTNSTNGLVVRNSGSTSSVLVNDRGQLIVNTTSDASGGPGNESIRINSTGDANLFVNSVGGGNIYPTVQFGNAGTVYSTIYGVGNSLFISTMGIFEFRDRNTNARLILKDSSQNWLFTLDPTGTQGASARVQVNGPGATSGTYGFIVSDSGGTTNTLVVRDDKKVGIGTTSISSKLQIRDDTADGTSIMMRVENSATTAHLYVNSTGNITSVATSGGSHNFSTTSDYLNVNLDAVIGPTLAWKANGAQLSSLSSAAGLSRFIQSASQNLAVYDQFNDFYFYYNDTNKAVGIGKASNPSASESLRVTGKRSDSAGSTLTTYNSAGTATFTVRDDGVLFSGATPLTSIFTPSTSGISGSLTSGYIPLANGAQNLTNSVITQSGTGVTVNGSIYIYGNVDVLGTATTFNTQTVQTADNNITMNLSGSHVSALYGGINVLSGKTDNSPASWTVDSTGAWSANTPGYFTGLRADSAGNTFQTFSSGGTSRFLLTDDGGLLANSTTMPSVIGAGGNAHINSRLMLGSGDDSTGLYIGRYNGSSYPFGIIAGVQSTTSFGTAGIALQTSSLGTPRMTLMAWSGGNVTIEGTSGVPTAPVAMFDVRNNNASQEIQKWYNSSNVLKATLTESGNLGIGNASPSARIHISGSSSGTSSFSQKIDNSIATGLLYIRDDGQIGAGSIAGASQGTLSFGFNAGGFVDINNTFIGTDVATSVAAGGNRNTGVGASAMGGLTTGARNSALGNSALGALSSGFGNTAMGWSSAGSVTTTQYTTAFGYNALVLNNSGENTAVGADAGSSSTGAGLALFGYQAWQLGTTGVDNSVFGFTALRRNVTGNRNSVFGNSAGHFNLSAGSDNVFIGYQTGYFNNELGSGSGTLGASQNTFIGTQAGYSYTGSGSTIIGFQAAQSLISGNNQLIIDNGNNAIPLIYGDFSTDRIGLGTVNPQEKLHISGGTIRIQTTNGTEGVGKLAVSDANGSISFSSTTALGISTTGSTVTKYTTTTTLANSGTTITHNLNTNFIICAFWDASGNPIIPQYQRTSANAIGVSAATTGTYDIVIHG